MKTRIISVLFLVIAAVLGFVIYKRPSWEVINTGDPVPGSKDKAVSLEQGWTVATQQAYYFTNQGSRILPYEWFLVLEMPDSQELFRGDKNMRNLRYLPTDADKKWNPDGLPVGFVRDIDLRKTTWLGMTCAACHTGQIAYNGKEIRIDGGQTMADIDAFDLSLVKAMDRTLEDGEKFGRFQEKLLGKDAPAGKSNELRDSLKKQTEALRYRNLVNHFNSPDMPEYGYGRTDAIGQIFNKVLVHMNELPENARASDAPVSYPFLWGTHQSDVVQWTGFAPNGPSNFGSLIRNGGEVLGVYGEMEIPEDKRVNRYQSSIIVESIGLLERWIAGLRSPRWPSGILPEIDKELALKGKIHYEKYCVECHATVTRENEGLAYKSVMTSIDEVGTDSREYDNMVKPRKAGKFAGRREAGIAGPIIPDETTGLGPLINSVVGGLLEQHLDTLKANITISKGAINVETLRESVKNHNFGDAALSLDKLLMDFEQRMSNIRTNPVLNSSLPKVPKVYKARPLNGIWATAPYLHNGSVPNLREILLPAAKRSATFHLGTREYDPEAVGYKEAVEFEGRKSFVFDTSLPGNSNAGHEYGAKEGQLDDTQRRELLEYLKSL